jgi:hypothetical protein
MFPVEVPNGRRVPNMVDDDDLQVISSWLESDGTAPLRSPLSEMSPETRQKLLVRYREYLEVDKMTPSALMAGPDYQRSIFLLWI